MNVPADLMLKLARACAAPVDANAEGVVRTAIERLTGEREYWVEVRVDAANGGEWDVHSVHPLLEGARQVERNVRALPECTGVRVVELIRRVLPP